MAPLAPEAGHRFPDRDVLPGGVGVDVAGVGELGGGGGGDEVDLGVGEGLEGGEGELLGEGVHFGVLEEVVARGVDGGDRRARFEAARGELVGEVFARVEVFEEAGCGFEVVVEEVDGVFLFSWVSFSVCVCGFWKGRGKEGWRGEGMEAGREGERERERCGGRGELTGEAESGAIASAKNGDLMSRA